jgi:hypothetical protein
MAAKLTGQLAVEAAGRSASTLAPERAMKGSLPEICQKLRYT